MVRLQIVLGLVTFAFWVYCLVSVISSDDGAIRHLPKIAWLLIVLFFPLVGSVAWLVAGRPRTAAGPSPYERAAPEFPEYDRPGRAAAVDPDADEKFLREVRERAEEQRRRHREQRKARSQPPDTDSAQDPNRQPPGSEPPT